jgi:3-phenylpropionate/trans-cinnamate dioxygenase ferredoxin subunit
LLFCTWDALRLMAPQRADRIAGIVLIACLDHGLADPGGPPERRLREPMNTPIPLIELSALPEGRGRRVCKAGHDLALFRTGDAVFAIDDTCPHQGASLSNGRLQGTRVTCPAHGLKFDLAPGCPGAAATLEVKKYEVSTVDGMVMLTPTA